MLKTVICIPARWGSERLPGKPLAKVGNKPMIQWVIEAAKKTVADEVFVLTDNERIGRVAYENGAEYIIDKMPYKTGTDRIIGSLEKISNFNIIVNLQGDEPLINPDDINFLIRSLTHDSTGGLFTLVTDLNDRDSKNRNCVKAKVTGGYIDMFTRSPIYSNNDESFYKHIGVYGFSKNILKNISKLKEQTDNEIGESLEQLRWMDNGMIFKYIYTKNNHKGVDTIEDLDEINKFLKTNS